VLSGSNEYVDNLLGYVLEVLVGTVKGCVGNDALPAPPAIAILTMLNGDVAGADV
jgi:hypothetical protein